MGRLHERDLVVGGVLHLNAVSEPANRGCRVGLDAAVEVSVVAQSLLVSTPLDVNVGRELHLDEDVASGARVDIVVRYAIVRPSVGLCDVVHDEDVALVDGASGRQEAVVLPPPADARLWVARGVALQLDGLARGGDHWASAVVGDEGRYANVDVNVYKGKQAQF